jgi:hypothetical protein
MNPWGDCKRVLTVSMGKNKRSTEVPAAPPALQFDENLDMTPGAGAYNEGLGERRLFSVRHWGYCGGRTPPDQGW